MKLAVLQSLCETKLDKLNSASAPFHHKPCLTFLLHACGSLNFPRTWVILLSQTKTGKHGGAGGSQASSTKVLFVGPSATRKLQ